MAFEDFKETMDNMSDKEFEQLLDKVKPFHDAEIPWTEEESFNDVEIPWTEDKQVNIVETALYKAKNLTNNVTEQYWYQEGYYDGAKEQHKIDIEKVCAALEALMDTNLVDFHNFDKAMEFVRKKMEE